MTERCAYHWFVFGNPPDMDDATTHLTTLWMDMLGIPDKEQAQT